MKTLLFLFVMGSMVCAMAQNQNGYKAGDPIGDFSLKNVNGKMVSLADFKDAKGLIIVVTCNTCPYAQRYEDRLVQLHKQLSPKGFPVVAINPNDPKLSPGDSYEAMQKRAKEKKFPFPYLLDQDQEVTRALGSLRTPDVTLVEKTQEGWIVRYQGAIDDNAYRPEEVKRRYVVNAVEQLLKSQPITPEKTKSLGCTVKWRSI